MGGIAKPWIPAIYSKGITNSRALSQKSLDIISKELPFNMSEKNSDLDLVYIVKFSDKNDDLKYSLRSVAKFCNYRKIWIVGYKPKWVQNVEYIETLQTGTKWQNSMLNWKTACETAGISDNFVLMNDDFIAIHPINDIKKDVNVCLSDIPTVADRYSKKHASKWQTGFISAEELLTELHSKTFFNMETHLPFIVNKKQYLKMLELPQIKNFDNTKVLHKRSIYYNLYYNSLMQKPRKITDVKISLHKDLSDSFLNENWISVFDDVIGNLIKYPRVNQFLRKLFPNKCIYEV